MEATLNEVTLNKDEILRYSRHIIIPEVGMEGQLKLKNAHRLDQIKDARDARGSLIAKDLDLQRMVRESDAIWDLAQDRDYLINRERRQIEAPAVAIVGHLDHEGLFQRLGIARHGSAQHAPRRAHTAAAGAARTSRVCLPSGR